MLPNREAAGAMPAGGIGGSSQIDAQNDRSSQSERRTDSMQFLKDLEVGVMFWAERDTLDEIQSLAVRCGQLGIGGGANIDHHFTEDWKKALAERQFTLVTVFAAYNGESYADIPTVQRTVGFMP